MATTVTLNSGTLGAFAPWTTTHPIALNGTPANLALRAADAAGTACDFTLAGALTGAGGFSKTGGGTLTLSAANTFAGSVDVDAGTLRLTGSLATGGTVNLNGGTLAGNGTINKPVVLNTATLAVDDSATLTLGGSGLTWNGGGAVAVNLGASGVSGHLALSGALTKGATTGAFTLVLNAG